MHLAAVEKKALPLAVTDHGTVAEQLVAAKKRKGRTDEEANWVITLYS